MLDPVIVLRLIAAHVLSDMVLNELARQQTQKARPRTFLSTVFLGGLLRSALFYSAAANWNPVWILPVTFAGHAMIEVLVPRIRKTLGWFALRQAAHLILIATIWVSLTEAGISRLGTLLYLAAHWPALWVVLVALLVVVWPVGQAIGLFTEPWRKQSNRVSQHGLDNAGLWIGRLERILVVISILVGHYELIGFLVAAKSILRFADIKAAELRQEAEYILVGTMLSFAFAIGVGIIAKALLARWA